MTADIRLHPPPDPEPDSFDQIELSVLSDPDLLAEGWVRRHLAGPERAQESIDLYRSLGFQTRAVELTAADFDASCADCAAAICRSYVLIYTRKDGGDTSGEGNADPGDDSFNAY